MCVFVSYKLMCRDDDNARLCSTKGHGTSRHKKQNPFCDRPISYTYQPEFHFARTVGNNGNKIKKKGMPKSGDPSMTPSLQAAGVGCGTPTLHHQTETTPIIVICAQTETH